MPNIKVVDHVGDLIELCDGDGDTTVFHATNRMGTKTVLVEYSPYQLREIRDWITDRLETISKRRDS